MTVDFNDLPCELGKPGRLPIPVDPVDGGSVDEPEDDGDDILRRPVEPVPTIWACIAVSPGVNPSGRLCKQYSINQVPAGALSLHATKEECERVCRRARDPDPACPPKFYVWCVELPRPPASLTPCPEVGIDRPDCMCVMTRNKGCFYAQVFGRYVNGECVYDTDAAAPESFIKFYGEQYSDCEAECKPEYDLICGDEGGGGGGGGTSTGPGTPTGPATPGPGTGPGPSTPGGGGGGGGGPSTPGPATGGPSTRPITPSYVNYYYCKEVETIVGCRYVAPGLGTGGGSGGWVESNIVGTDCRCKKKVRSCETRWHAYYPPAAPPSPSSGEYANCNLIPNCGTTTITPIPNTCPEGPRTIDITSGPITRSVIIIPNGNTNTGDDGNSGTVIQQGPDGKPIGESEIPENQNQEPLPEYQFDTAEIDFAVQAGFTIGDPTYFVINKESNVVVPTRSTIYNEIFSEVRDLRLDTALNNGIALLSDLNNVLASLSLTTIKQSVKKEVRDVLFNLTYPDGRPIPESKVAKAIKKHIIENTVSGIDVGYILSLKSRALLNEEAQRKILSLPTTQFGRKKAEIIQERQLAKQRASSFVPTVDTTPNATRGVLRALKNSKSLDPNAYQDQTSDLLKLWYILPTDINQRVLATASGTNHPIYISDRNTIPVTTSSGSSVLLPVDRLHYTISATTSSQVVFDVSSQDDIHRAYSLPNIVEQATLFDVGSKYETILTVSSPAASNLELEYSLSGQRPRYYILKMNRNTVEDVPETDSIFIRKTKVQYTLETSTPVIRELLKFRIYPWKVFTVDHNDPLLGHFNSSSIYEFIFTNFSMAQFGATNGEQIFVRRVPELIVILPTDKFNLNFYNGYSRLIDWNKRRIIFTTPPDPRYSKTGLDLHWAKIDDTYPNRNIDDELTVYGKKGTFTGRAGILSSGFREGSEPLPRRKHGFRAAVETASSIYYNYEVEGGILWSDLFVRLTADEYRSFKIGISNDMIDKLRIGQKTGVKLIHNRNDSYLKQTRILGLRSPAAQEVPIIINKERSSINKIL